MNSSLQKHLAERLGLEFQRPELLEQALTHKSFSESQVGHNEKLEFLGDAVLDLVLADALMRRFPDNDEGRLSKKRASLVNEKELSAVALRLGLQEHLRLGKSEIQSKGALKPRLLAGCLEALIGAIYLDAGFQKAQTAAESLFVGSFEREDAETDFSSDFKTRFQEVVQARKKSTPVYRLVTERGPSHARVFEVEVESDGRVWGRAEGSSKKMAEQLAAEMALSVFEKESES